MLWGQLNYRRKKMKKVQLEEQIRKLLDLKRSLTTTIYDLKEEIKVLNNENSNLKQMETNWHRDMKDFERRYKTHAEIVDGEASPESKVEVLKDLFKGEIENKRNRYLRPY